MYEVVVFHKHGYDCHKKTFNLLCNAEAYYNHIASEIEYEGCPIYMVVMYLDKMKIKEFRARKEVIHV